MQAPLLTRLGTFTARPSAFLIVLVYAGLWLVFDPRSLNWHSIATLATWMMTLLIQRAEHRDTQAIHAKLDELLIVNSKADNGVTHLDDKEPEEIERFRDEGRGTVEAAGRPAATPSDGWTRNKTDDAQ